MLFKLRQCLRPRKMHQNHMPNTSHVVWCLETVRSGQVHPFQNPTWHWTPDWQCACPCQSESPASWTGSGVGDPHSQLLQIQKLWRHIFITEERDQICVSSKYHQESHRPSHFDILKKMWLTDSSAQAWAKDSAAHPPTSSCRVQKLEVSKPPNFGPFQSADYNEFCQNTKFKHMIP